MVFPTLCVNIQRALIIFLFYSTVNPVNIGENMMFVELLLFLELYLCCLWNKLLINTI